MVSKTSTMWMEMENKMKINKSSWHYRLVKLGDPWDIPDDLCSYVRLLIWNIMGVSFTFALGIFLVVVGIWSPIHLVLYGIPDQQSALYGFYIIGSMVDVAVLICIIFYIIDWVREYLLEHREVKPPKPIKEPSFIKKAWKGFKEKTCYKIDFED